MELTVGEAVDIGGLERSLVDFGYERVEAVEQAGQWTRRGGILDIFPGDAALPFRVDFFGDDIESIRPFDVETQRSVGKVETLTVAAVREVPYEDAAVAEAVARLKRELPGRAQALKKANLDDRGAEHAERLEERVEGDIAQLQSHAYFDAMEYYLPYLYPDAVCALDYIPDDALIILDEPSQAKARWEQRETEIAEIMAARAARGEYLTPDMPHACGFETVVEDQPTPNALPGSGSGCPPSSSPCSGGGWTASKLTKRTPSPPRPGRWRTSRPACPPSSRRSTAGSARASAASSSPSSRSGCGRFWPTTKSPRRP